jgi:hypothetical protein
MLCDKESNYEFDRDGDPIVDVIVDLVNIPEQAAKDVQEELEWRFFSKSSMEIGEETEYCESSYYEYVGVSSEGWEEKWQKFEISLKTESRYFNQLGKDYLESVFEGVLDLDSEMAATVVEVGPAKELDSIYRSRVFLSDEQMTKALKNVVIELGPPPSRLAKAGRMNAAGISVFYGSTDSRTSLAEVRPPVGSFVAVARFKFLRNLKLLSLISLQSFTIKGSLFDSAYANLLSRVQFLNQLCTKMTVPVMPGFEETEYIVTQAISDFLSTRVDGIIFPSIQTNLGSNIVLFRKSSRVAVRLVPVGTETSVRLWDYDEDEGDIRSFEICEIVPELPSASSKPIELDKDERITSLELDESKLEIHEIKAVDFTTNSNLVHFRQEKKYDFDEYKRKIFGER